jgi:hypothetical protein
VARSKGLSAQKRLRERKKAEKAELKREQRRVASQSEREPGAKVARREDLEGYGVIARTDPDDES